MKKVNYDDTYMYTVLYELTWSFTKSATKNLLRMNTNNVYMYMNIHLQILVTWPQVGTNIYNNTANITANNTIGITCTYEYAMYAWTITLQVIGAMDTIFQCLPLPQTSICPHTVQQLLLVSIHDTCMHEQDTALG